MENNQKSPPPNDSPQTSGIPETPPTSDTHVSASQGEALQGYRRKFPIPKIVFLGIIFLFLFAVIAGAYFLGKNSANNNSSPAPTSAPTPTPDPTADWNTFQGEGFSFKYPNTWVIIDPCHEDSSLSDSLCFASSDFVASASPTQTEKGSEITLFKEYLIPFKAELNNCDDRDYSLCEVKNFGDFTTLTMQDDESTNFKEVIIQNNISFEEIGLYVKYNSQSKKTTNSVFDQILSTFKFEETESAVDTSNWKTYNSKLEGLSFKYPNNWIETKTEREGYEALTLTTPSGYEFNYTFSTRNRSGGCLDCYVTYSEKVTVLKFKDLYILENDRGGAPGFGVIYLAENNVPVGEKGLNWFITSKNDSDRDLFFQGEFRDESGYPKSYSPEEFSATPEVQATRQILRSISY